VNIIFIFVLIIGHRGENSHRNDILINFEFHFQYGPMTTATPRTRVGLTALLVLAGLVAGCAADLARASAGAIGCPHTAIAVEDISVGWSETSWTARCRGLVFHCSGEDAPSCAPELDVTDTPATRPPGHPNPNPNPTQGRSDAPLYP
jgi:hypothetical protein